ncbi:MAG: glycosyltransferase family 2 protein [Clostridia bacterium]|nr:glycosyltransferase family 2 protein [Clostridia bacterium]
MRNNDTLYIVVPCYNEEAALPETSRVLLGRVAELAEGGRVSAESRVLFVDDGSKDGTWDFIAGLKAVSPYAAGLKLSRNRGHQNALLAGLLAAKEDADMAISVDADLQDDVSVIDGFLDKYYEGFDVVYGVRSDRSSDSAFKRGTARRYYRTLRKMGVEIVPDHADCRLMSKRALQALAEFKEVNLFLRGLVPLVGFPSATVEYPRRERKAGESKYSLKKMLALAWQGVTSMSVRPIRLILSLGVTLLLLGIAALIAFSIVAACGHPEWQWTIILAAIAAACGLNLTATGIVGEYVGKVYLETKARPRYIVEDYFK